MHHGWAFKLPAPAFFFFFFFLLPPRAATEATDQLEMLKRFY